MSETIRKTFVDATRTTVGTTGTTRGMVSVRFIRTR